VRPACHPQHPPAVFLQRGGQHLGRHGPRPCRVLGRRHDEEAPRQRVHHTNDFGQGEARRHHPRRNDGRPHPRLPVAGQIRAAQRAQAVQRRAGADPRPGRLVGDHGGAVAAAHARPPVPPPRRTRLLVAARPPVSGGAARGAVHRHPAPRTVLEAVGRRPRLGSRPTPPTTGDRVAPHGHDQGCRVSHRRRQPRGRQAANPRRAQGRQRARRLPCSGGGVGGAEAEPRPPRHREGGGHLPRAAVCVPHGDVEGEARGLVGAAQLPLRGGGRRERDEHTQKLDRRRHDGDGSGEQDEQPYQRIQVRFELTAPHRRSRKGVVGRRQRAREARRAAHAGHVNLPQGGEQTEGQVEAQEHLGFARVAPLRQHHDGRSDRVQHRRDGEDAPGAHRAQGEEGVAQLGSRTQLAASNPPRDVRQPLHAKW